MTETIHKDNYVVKQQGRNKEFFQIYSRRGDLYRAYKVVNGHVNKDVIYSLASDEIKKITVINIGATRTEIKRIATPHFNGEIELDPTIKLSKIVDMNTNDFIISFHCSHEARVLCSCSLAARISRVIELPYQRQRRIFKVKLNIKVLS